MNKYYCKICDKELIFNGKSAGDCLNTPQINNTKTFHYTYDKSIEHEYFWYPEFGINISKYKFYTTICSSSEFDQQNLNFNITLQCKDFNNFNFDPKNIEKLIQQLKMWRTYQ